MTQEVVTEKKDKKVIEDEQRSDDQLRFFLGDSPGIALFPDLEILPYDSFSPHQDLISALPIFNLYNRDWPIYSQQLNSPPAKFVRDGANTVGTAIDSIVSLGCVISGGISNASCSARGSPWIRVRG